MKKVGYDELKKFCLNFDELRPVMMDPHHMKEGLWVASDSRVLIIVEDSRCKSDIANEVKKSKKKNELLYKYFKGEYPKVFEIFDPYEHKYKNQLKYTHTIKLAALEEALDKVPMIEEQKEVINNVDAI